jgi:two-component system sensor kinase FixL
VIFGLMRNAVEAMAGAASRDLRVSTARSETDITVSIADTGPGVPLEIAARLFQPGVTSKPDRTGMDLGISNGGTGGSDRRAGRQQPRQ